MLQDEIESGVFLIGEAEWAYYGAGERTLTVVDDAINWRLIAVLDPEDENGKLTALIDEYSL